MKAFVLWALTPASAPVGTSCGLFICKHGDDLQTLKCKSLTRAREKQIKYSEKRLIIYPSKVLSALYVSSALENIYCAVWYRRSGSFWLVRDDHMTFFGTSRPVIRVTCVKKHISAMNELKYNLILDFFKSQKFLWLHLFYFKWCLTLLFRLMNVKMNKKKFSVIYCSPERCG